MVVSVVLPGGEGFGVGGGAGGLKKSPFRSSVIFCHFESFFVIVETIFLVNC